MKHAIVAVAAVILLLTPRASSDKKKNLTFTVTVRGEIEDTEATEAGFRTSLFQYAHLAFTNLDASDGEAVTIYHGQFRTADEANRYFDWYLKKRAAQVVKQEDKADRDGKTVGRRADFLLKSDQKEKTWSVMWTDGVHSIQVTAPTLECAQEVERQSRE